MITKRERRANRKWVPSLSISGQFNVKVIVKVLPTSTLMFFSLQPLARMFSRFMMMMWFLLRPWRVHRWQIWASLATTSYSFRKILWSIIARIKCHPRGEYRSFAQNYTVSQFWERSRVVSRIAEHPTTDHYYNFVVGYQILIAADEQSPSLL